MSSENPTNPTYPPLAAPSLLQSARILTSHLFTSTSADPTLTPDPVRTVISTRLSELSKACTSLRAMWVGHASIILDFPTENAEKPFRLLTDPLFSKGCGPIGWPERTVDAPFDVEDLGWVNAVVISHDHYDHLDHRSIMQIESLNSGTKYFVPFGVGSWFAKRGISRERIVELDWWGSATLGGLSSGLEVSTKDDGPATKTKEDSRLRRLLKHFGRKKNDGDGDTVENTDEVENGLKVELDETVVSPVVPTLSAAGTKGQSEVVFDVPLESGDFEIPSWTPRADEIDEAKEEDDLAITSIDPVQTDPSKTVKNDTDALVKSNEATITITCLPAHHNTGRNLLLIDKDRSKPATWLVQVSPTQDDPEGTTVFFGGDSGYQGADGKKTRLYQDIRDRYGPVHLALLPIASGSLSSRFHLPDRLVQHLHAMPSDAVEQFVTLTKDDHPGSEGKRKRRVGLGMHYTTLDSESGAQQTMRDLEAALRGSQVKKGWEDKGFTTVDAGVWRSFDELG